MDADRREELHVTIGKRTNAPLIALSVAVIPLLIYEVASNDPPSWVDYANVAIWAVFAVELAVMTYLSGDRFAELRKRWYELPILLIPLVSTSSLGVLRSLRVLRSARALRAVRATRAGAALFRGARPALFLLERHGLQYVLALGALVYLVCAALLVRIEDGGNGDAQDFGRWLLWCTTIVTSLNFGLAVPERGLGRAVAVVAALVGVTLISIITANIAAFLLRHEKSDSASRDFDKSLDRL